jgi:septum formation initiator
MHKKRKVKKRTWFNIRGYKVSIFAVLAVVLMLAEITGYRVYKMSEKQEAYMRKIKDLEAGIDAEKARSEELNKLKIYVQTKDYIEDVAKEKLGLVNPDELILKPEK